MDPAAPLSPVPGSPAFPTWAALGLLVVLASCAPAGDTPPGLVVRDSAGITLVDSPAPREAEPWRLDPEPVLVIGMAEGEEPYLLSGVGDALLLADGGVALVDGASRQLRLYGSDGGFRAAAGGPGEGPGEFRQLNAPLLGEADGGFSLWDPGLRRITRLTAELSLEETILPEPVEGASGMLLRGRFRDGTLLMSEVRQAASLASGPFRDTLRLHRVDPNGRPLNPLAALPSGAGDIQIEGGTNPGTLRAISIFRDPLSPTAHTAAGEGLVGGTGDGFHLTSWAADGSVRWLARLHRPLRPADSGEVEAFIEAMAARSPDPAATRTFYEGRSFPPVFPAFDRLVMDDRGNSWMRVYHAPHDRGDARWLVLDPEGGWRADALLPGGLQVTRITGDRVVGVFRDELDVESVRVFRILRSTPLRNPVDP